MFINNSRTLFSIKVFFLRLSYAIILFLFITSCANKQSGDKNSNLVLTINEDKGIKDIIAAFGGTCTYGFGSTVSSEKKAVKYFWLELSECKMIDTYDPYVKDPILPLSKMAYLFYNNLSTEKTDYSEIHTAILYSKTKKVSKVYKIDDLEIVKSKMPIVLNVVDLLKKSDYEGLKSIFSKDSSIFKVNREQLINNISKNDSIFGNITGFVPEGFLFKNFENGKTVLHISGMILRDKTNNVLSVDLDPKSASGEILYLNYQYAFPE